MLFLVRTGARLAWRAAVASILVGAVHLQVAGAQIIESPQKLPEAAVVPSAPAEAAVPAPAAPAPLAKPYYIEFRSRSAHNYGHTFSIYGRLSGPGKIASKTVAGLHPATESSVPWVIGHFVAVPSETGASDGDLEDQYVTARFHVALTADEYKKVVGFIKSLQAKSPVWHAVAYNCNAFVGDIAKFMGMEPPGSMLMPAAYIEALKEQNIGKTGLIGTPTKVVSAEALRAQALKSGGRARKEGTKDGSTTGGSQAAPATRPQAAPAARPQAASDTAAETTGHAPAAAAPKPAAKPAQRTSAVKEPEPKPIPHNIH
jgi:hypothetical protein